MCFVAHRNKETTVATKQWRKVSEVSASKTNPFEVRMVVKTVRYLLLQGYEPDQVCRVEKKTGGVYLGIHLVRDRRDIVVVAARSNEDIFCFAFSSQFIR